MGFQAKQRYVIAPASYLDKRQRRLGNDLDPVALTAAIARADDGFLDAFCDILDEVRETDGTLNGLLGKRERRVAGAKIAFIPPEKSGKSTARAKKCADFVTRVLTRSRGFRTMLADLMAGCWYGRSAVENVWAKKGRNIIPVKYVKIHSRRLSYSSMGNWNLYLYDTSMTGETRFGLQTSMLPGVAVDDPRAFPAGKLSVFTPRINGLYPHREGLGRTAVWYSLFKRASFRDWLSKSEQEGKRPRVGTWNTGKPDQLADDDAIAALREYVENGSASAGVVLPDTVRIEKEVEARGGASKDIQQAIIQECNAELSKLVAGGTLMTDAGDKGARSLGDNHADEQEMIAVFDAYQLAEVIFHCLVIPLCEMNGFDADIAPMVIIDVLTNRDPARVMELLVLAKEKLGVNIPESYIRTLLALPEDKDKDGLDDTVDPDDTTADASPAGNESDATQPTKDAAPDASAPADDTAVEATKVQEDKKT